jgi:hypothetical protein
MSLSLTGQVAGKDFAVHRLVYPDRPRWREVIPPGTSLPFLVAGAETLDGGLPVLQFLEETIPGSRLLPEGAVERVRVRNRAIVAADLLEVMRLVFVAKSPAEEHEATEDLFAHLSRCEAQAWSPEPRLDWVLLAAASTILASQPKVTNDTRWSACPSMRARTLALSEEDLVRATRADGYDAAFAAFFRVFGSTFAAPDPTR